MFNVILHMACNRMNEKVYTDKHDLLRGEHVLTRRVRIQRSPLNTDYLSDLKSGKNTR